MDNKKTNGVAPIKGVLLEENIFPEPITINNDDVVENNENK